MKKFQPKFYKSRRSFLHQTAFSVSSLATQFIYSPAYSGMNWQKAFVSFPEMPIYNEDGTELNLKQFIGKPLLINFWATWCAPCITELPHFDNAVDHLKQNDIVLLLISTDRGPRKEISLFLDKLKIFKPLRAFDPKAIWAKQFKVSALPVTFLINASQTKSVFFVGAAAWSETEVINEVNAQLNSLTF